MRVADIIKLASKLKVKVKNNPSNSKYPYVIEVGYVRVPFNSLVAVGQALRRMELTRSGGVRRGKSALCVRWLNLNVERT